MTEQDSLLPTDEHEQLLKRAEELSRTLPFDEVVCEIAYAEHCELFPKDMNYKEKQSLREKIVEEAKNRVKGGETSYAKIRKHAIPIYFSIQKSMYEYNKRCAENDAKFRAREKAKQEKWKAEQKARQAEEARRLAIQREQEWIQYEKYAKENARYFALRDADILIW